MLPTIFPFFFSRGVLVSGAELTYIIVLFWHIVKIYTEEDMFYELHSCT
jgi:hypothetical protein